MLDCFFSFLFFSFLLHIYDYQCFASPCQENGNPLPSIFHACGRFSQKWCRKKKTRIQVIIAENWDVRLTFFYIFMIINVWPLHDEKNTLPSIFLASGRFSANGAEKNRIQVIIAETEMSEWLISMHIHDHQCLISICR